MCSSYHPAHGSVNRPCQFAGVPNPFSAVTLCTKVSTGGKPENVPRALAGSLERLGVDCVDVYKMHSPDPATPIDETLDALNAEVKAGRIRVIGASNYSGAQLEEALTCSAAHGYARFEITQPAATAVKKSANAGT